MTLSRWLFAGALIGMVLAGTLIWDYRNVSHDVEEDAMGAGGSLPDVAKSTGNHRRGSERETSTTALTQARVSAHGSDTETSPVASSPQVSMSPIVQEKGQEAPQESLEPQEQIVLPLGQAPEHPPEVPGIFASLPPELASKVVNSERLTSIAQDFTEKVKAAGWDTTSEAYKKAWKEAAQESDDQLRSTIGEEAFIKLKMEQARNGY